MSQLESEEGEELWKIASGERNFEENENIGDVDDRGAYTWSIIKYYKNGRRCGVS